MVIDKAKNELGQETATAYKAKKRYLAVVKSNFRKLNYCVNNEWKESKTTKYMPVTDSSTGEAIAEAPCCTREEVVEAVKAAK